MNTYTPTLLFYVIALIIIYILNKISPNAHDGGFGLGGIAIILLGLTIVILLGLNVYKGFSVDKEYFIIASIHFVILAIGVYRLLL